MSRIPILNSRGRYPRRSVPVQSTPTPPIVGDTTNSYVEQRLLSDVNVQFIWNQDNPLGPMETLGGSGFDEHNGNSNGSLSTIRSFVSSPATYGGENIGTVEKLRFPVPGENNSLQSSTLTYGQYCRRRFTSLGMASFRDLYFRYAVYLPVDFNPYDGGKLPALMSVPANQSLGGYMSGGTTYHDDSWWAGIMFVGPSPMQGTYPNKFYSGDSSLDHIRIQSYIYAKQVNGQVFTAANVADRSVTGYAVKAKAGLNQDETAAATGTGTGTGSYLYMNRGAWNTVEQHVTMNTSGQTNGKYRLWLNGTLGVNLQNIIWPTDPYNATAIINGLMNDTFFGGPSGAASTQQMYLADYVMSSAYIGPRHS